MTTGEKLNTPKSSDWDDFWWNNKAPFSYAHASWSKKRIMAVLKPYLQPGKRALDAGCGSGFFTKVFIDNGMKATAVDYSPKAVAITSVLAKDKAVVKQKDLLSPQFSKEFPDKFDLIFSDGLLEHFPRAQQDVIVKNLAAVLNPQGALVTFVPNRWSPWELIRPFYMPGIDEAPFTLGQLVRLNEDNGLSVIKKGGVNTLPFAFSLEGAIAGYFGMLLYTIAKVK